MEADDETGFLRVSDGRSRLRGFGETWRDDHDCEGGRTGGSDGQVSRVPSLGRCDMTLQITKHTRLRISGKLDLVVV